MGSSARWLAGFVAVVTLTACGAAPGDTVQSAPTRRVAAESTTAPVPVADAGAESAKAGAPAVSGKHYSPIPVPPGDQVVDVAPIGGGRAWALISAACGTGRCAVLSYSSDGGAAWHRLPATRIPVDHDFAGCRSPCGVSRVVFADAHHGFLFAPGFYVTDDGGRTWHEEPGPAVVDLSVTSAGSVLRVVHGNLGCSAPCSQYVERSSSFGHDWTTVVDGPQFTFGLPISLVAAPGGPAYVFQPDNMAGGVVQQPQIMRSVDGRSWQKLPDPCAVVSNGEAVSLGAFGDRLGVLCQQHAGKGQSLVRMSADDGTTFARAERVPLEFAGGLSLTADRVLVSTSPMGGQGTAELGAVAADYLGWHWTRPLRDTCRLADELITYNTLRVAGSDALWVGCPFALFTSTDGGTNWSRHPAGSL